MSSFWGAAYNNPVSKFELEGLEGFYAQLFSEYIIQPYQKYIQGGLDYLQADNSSKNDRDYIQNTPQHVRGMNDLAGKLQAVGKSAEGAGEILSTNGMLMAPLEAGAVAAVKPAVSVLREVSEAAAIEIRAGNNSVLKFNPKNFPSVVAAQKDNTTKEILISISGKPRPASLVSPLKEQAPSKSLTLVNNVMNCAETKGVNTLVKEGSEIINIKYHATKVTTGKPMPTCLNCQQTLRGATHVP